MQQRIQAGSVIYVDWTAIILQTYFIIYFFIYWMSVNITWAISHSKKSLFWASQMLNYFTWESMFGV